MANITLQDIRDLQEAERLVRSALEAIQRGKDTTFSSEYRCLEFAHRLVSTSLNSRVDITAAKAEIGPEADKRVYTILARYEDNDQPWADRIIADSADEAERLFVASQDEKQDEDDESWDGPTTSLGHPFGLIFEGVIEGNARILG